MNLDQLYTIYKAVAKTSGTFEESISPLMPTINDIAPNPQNWQFIFDTFHWFWGEDHQRLTPDELDRLALAYSPYRECTEAIIQQQIEDAREFGKALTGADITPMEGLTLAMKQSRFIVESEANRTAIASHPSPIALPQQIVQLYRQFYRAKKRYNPERSNALRPLTLAKEVIARSDSIGEDLAVEVAGRIVAFTNQVRRNTAKGRWVIPNQSLERQEISTFASFIVHQVLAVKFNGDKSQFSQKSGIGLIEDACYYLYLLEQDRENRTNTETEGKIDEQ